MEPKIGNDNRKCTKQHSRLSVPNTNQSTEIGMNSAKGRKMEKTELPETL